MKKAITYLLAILLLLPVSQSCTTDDVVNPNLIYAQWEMVSYENSSDDIEVTKVFLDFYKDNVMTMNESSEVVGEAYYFTILDKKLYISEEKPVSYNNYLTIKKLDKVTLILRLEADGIWSECTFTKKYTINQKYSDMFRDK